MQISPAIVDAINNGSVGVLPTDTIFGIVGSVKYPKSVKRIYEVKGRTADKRMICLIGDTSQLKELGIELNEFQKDTLNKIWPGPYSVDLLCSNKLPHIHLGFNSIAVRFPDSSWLNDLIRKTGPIVATSANKSGEQTSKDIEAIKKSLPGLDFYIDGVVGSEPSKLIRLKDNGEIEDLSRG